MAYARNTWVDNSPPDLAAVNLNKNELGIVNAGAPPATVTVAAVDASAKWRAAADFVCTGAGDQAQLNAAVAALPAVGGKILLSEGNFFLTSSMVVQKDTVTVEGMGLDVTELHQSTGFTGRGMIDINRDDLTGVNLRPAQGCRVRDLTVNGHYLGTQGTNDGIYFKCYEGNVGGVRCFANNGYGIRLRGVTGAERGGGNEWSTFRTVIGDYGHTYVSDCGLGGVGFTPASTDAGIGHGIEIHECAGPGIYTLAANMWVAAGTMIWGCRTNSGGQQGAGIYIDSGAARCNIFGAKLEQNRGGVLVAGGFEILIEACTFASNSNHMTGNTSSGAMPAGWYTAGLVNQTDDVNCTAGANTVGIIGNIFDGNVYTGDQSRYNVNLNSGNTYAILGNRITGGGTGGIITTGASAVTQANNW